MRPFAGLAAGFDVDHAVDLPDLMTAVPIRGFGAPGVLRAEQWPVPRPGPGQVLIQAEAISVGLAQTQMRRNCFPGSFWRPTLPLVLGGDVVGRLVAVGQGVDPARIGDRVGCFLLTGGYADYVTAPAGQLVEVPQALDAAEATVLPGTGLIAAGVIDLAALGPGQSVLVQAAAGGVGHIAVQLARLAGAGPVIATAASPASRDFALRMGADVVVDYTRRGWEDEVRAATADRGVDVLLDGVGGDVLASGPRLLAPGGRLVFYGAAGGRGVPAVSPLELMSLQAVTGFTLSAWRSGRPAAFAAGLRRLTGHLLDGSVRSQVHDRLPLGRAAAGHEALENRGQLGRIVLIPQSR